MKANFFEKQSYVDDSWRAPFGGFRFINSDEDAEEESRIQALGTMIMYAATQRWEMTEDEQEDKLMWFDSPAEG